MVREERIYQAIIYEKEDQIAHITLNRPEKRNAFDDTLYQDLLAGVGEASEDDDVRVIVIKGAGQDFSSGHDLSSPKGNESPPIDPRYHPTVRDFFQLERRRCGKYEDILNCPKVTIAQVHGRCIGAGEGIHASCDFTIAADDAVFGTRGFGRFTMGVFVVSALTHGLHGSFNPWPCGSEKPRAGMILPEISGRKAADLGLINRAVPGEQLEEEVNRWAKALTLIPNDLMALAKETINGIDDIGGYGSQMRNHYDWHIALQFVRFRPDETSLYKTRRDTGLKGFIQTRAMHATPQKGT
jgi:enoyl-CoA hydratase